jgi:hypothetical protein
MLEASVLEEVRVEQYPQHRADVVVRLAESRRQQIDSLRIAWGLDRPRWHLRLIRDEEIIEMARDKAATGRLTDDDVDDVLAIEPATVAEEFLLPVVMVFRAILEFPGETAVWQARNLGLEGPARETREASRTSFSV